MDRSKEPPKNRLAIGTALFLLHQETGGVSESDQVRDSHMREEDPARGPPRVPDSMDLTEQESAFKLFLQR